MGLGACRPPLCGRRVCPSAWRPVAIYGNGRKRGRLRHTGNGNGHSRGRLCHTGNGNNAT